MPPYKFTTTSLPTNPFQAVFMISFIQRLKRCSSLNNICIESCSSGDECLIASTRVGHSNDDQVSAVKESGRT